MKTERHRDRAKGPNTDASGVAPGSMPTPNGSTDESAIDGAPANGHTGTPGHQSDAALEPDNGYASLEDGMGTEDESAYDGNGYAHEAETPPVVLTLPRRKRRVGYAPKAPVEVVPAVAPAPEAVTIPEEKIVAPPVPAGVPLPPKAKRKTAATVVQPQPVVAAVAVEPATIAEPETARRQWRVNITLEGVFWVSLFALAIVTRLWDLSNRGIHHDESLHSVYGNNLYNGSGYIHDPMMHGPLQFHLIAFMYWLFGVNEMTARMASAFCGIWVVMAPFFLRRQMGKVPALIASFLLLISPSVLYFSRMAREDAIFSATETLMIVGLWRFVSSRKPADFFIFAAGLSLMFTIKEASYLTTAVVIGFFVLLFVIQSGYAIMAATAVYGALMGALLFYMRSNMQQLDANHQVIPGGGTIAPLPIIPDVGPSYDIIWRFVLDLFTHPLVLSALILTAAYVVAVTFLFRRERTRLEGAPLATPVQSRSRVVVTSRANGSGTLQTRVSRGNGNSGTPVVAQAVQPIATVVETPRQATLDAPDDPDAASEVWDPRRLDPKPGSILGRYQPGSIPHLLGSLFARPRVILVGFLIAAAIYTVLYTVFFTDIPRGLLSGLFGSLGYWMAQHGVERGSQPWYYYFLLLPLYEPIGVFFSLVGTVFFGWRGIRWLRNRRAEARYTENPPRFGAFNVDRPVPFANFQPFLVAFLIWWLFGVTAIYTWAGEKMPWLMMHMARPAILLASLFLGALLLSMLARRRERIEAAAVQDERYVAYGPGIPALATGGMMRSTLARFAQPGLQMAAAMPGGGSASLDMRGGQLMSMSRGSGPQRSRPSAHTSARRSAPPPPVPVRRGGRVRGAAVAVARRQDPPWVAWNMPSSNFPVLSFMTLFVLFAMSWAMTMTFQIAQNNNYATWSWTWLWPGLMLALVIAFVAWLGPGRALKYLALGLFSVFFLYQFRSAIMLSYFHPDVPTEMAVYVQTSPDVTRFMKEVKDFSRATTGRNDVKVLYDSDVSWPFSWYFHDFPNAQFIGNGDPQPAADVPIMVFGYDTKNSNTELLKNYTSQRYAMRWWFPEDWYKKDLVKGLAEGQTPKNAPLATAALLVVKLGDTFTKPDNEATLWKYLLFRETPQPLGSYDMLVYVRKDVAPYYHYLQYDPIPSHDIP